MTITAGRSSKQIVPRLIRSHKLVQQWLHSSRWSPQDIFEEFDSSTTLNVKHSDTIAANSNNNRFFMYEEMDGPKMQDKDGPTVTKHTSPLDLAHLLSTSNNSSDYYYWTSPISNVCPSLISKRQIDNYSELLIDSSYVSQNNAMPLEDPRGPSLWMGNSGSATQAHYDVADNIIVQLFGTKRLRLFPPSCFTSLYVFPDAHPRARKSQVNFDWPDFRKYPKFAYAQQHQDFMDIVLQPGDVIEIPAFWFHHVENGKLPSASSWNTGAREENHTSTTIIDGPSVSLNIFGLSKAMMIAQDIFRAGSSGAMFHDVDQNQISSILRELAYGLLEGLHRQQQRLKNTSSPSSSLSSLSTSTRTTTPRDAIEMCLLETRYRPLLQSNNADDGYMSTNLIKDKKKLHNNFFSFDSPMQYMYMVRQSSLLTESQKQQIHDCITNTLPLFEQLTLEIDNDPNGIGLIIACHLMELWAVQLVGPNNVATIWEDVISEE